MHLTLLITFYLQHNAVFIGFIYCECFPLWFICFPHLPGSASTQRHLRFVPAVVDPRRQGWYRRMTDFSHIQNVNVRNCRRTLVRYAKVLFRFRGRGLCPSSPLSGTLSWTPFGFREYPTILYRQFLGLPMLWAAFLRGLNSTNIIYIGKDLIE